MDEKRLQEIEGMLNSKFALMNICEPDIREMIAEIRRLRKFEADWMPFLLAHGCFGPLHYHDDVEKYYDKIEYDDDQEANNG